MSGFGRGPNMNRAMTFDDRKSMFKVKSDSNFKPLKRRNTTFVERKQEPTTVKYDALLYRRFFGESPGEEIFFLAC